jgi:hypothetical protein
MVSVIAEESAEREMENDAPKSDLEQVMNFMKEMK